MNEPPTPRASGKPKYFVMSLDDQWRKPSDHLLYQVQVLSSSGKARLCIYFGLDDTQMVVVRGHEVIEAGYFPPDSMKAKVGGHWLPRPVLEAAKRQLHGKGDYVDETGQSVRPF